MEITRLERNYERWRRVVEEGIFKEDKYYVSHKSNDNDTTRDARMATEIQKGITCSANQQV